MPVSPCDGRQGIDFTLEFAQIHSVHPWFSLIHNFCLEDLDADVNLLTTWRTSFQGLIDWDSYLNLMLTYKVVPPSYPHPTPILLGFLLVHNVMLTSNRLCRWKVLARRIAHRRWVFTISILFFKKFYSNSQARPLSIFVPIFLLLMQFNGLW